MDQTKSYKDEGCVELVFVLLYEFLVVILGLFTIHLVKA